MSYLYRLVPRKSLLMIIKWIWKLNLFLSSKKALTSNFHVFFLGSLVFNLRFEKFPNNRFFSIWEKVLSTSTDIKTWNNLIPLPTLFLKKHENLSINYTKNFRFVQKNPRFSHQIGAVNTPLFMNCKLKQANMTTFAEQFIYFLWCFVSVLRYCRALLYFSIIRQKHNWENGQNNYLWFSVIMYFNKLCYWVLHLFFIFSALFLRTESRG